MNYEQEIKQLKSDRATILKMLETQQRTLNEMAKTVLQISQSVSPPVKKEKCGPCWGTGDVIVAGFRMQCDLCGGTGKIDASDRA